jgi:DNA ligase D
MGESHKERATLNVNGEIVTITNPMKKLWNGITKSDYLRYLITVSEYMLPFLKDRMLTVIRYPNGIEGEAFYQKNCPEYAPSYINTFRDDDTNFILCSNLQSLLWLGNQGAIEFHIPFQPVQFHGPSEIVFDLDPPSREEFSLAIEAAHILKEAFDKLHLTSYLKTSGNKGIQLLIPIKDGEFTYEETRIFTDFIANFLVKTAPKWFTIERLKKNRDNKLYVDFIQHAFGKTIIAPYSLRGNKDALVSTPLDWAEVTSRLRPEQFPMAEIVTRIKQGKNPFKTYDSSKSKNDLRKVIDGICANKA